MTVLPSSRARSRRSSSMLSPEQSQNPTASRRRSMPLPDSVRMSCRSGSSRRLPRSSSPHTVTVIRSPSGMTSMVAMQGGIAATECAGSGMAPFSLVCSPFHHFPALRLYPTPVNQYMKRSTCF
ncbi:hypothetical protein SVIOM74S_06123 [Streptomyces violarus]